MVLGVYRSGTVGFLVRSLFALLQAAPVAVEVNRARAAPALARRAFCRHALHPPLPAPLNRRGA
jgi:hypothetical protein